MDTANLDQIGSIDPAGGIIRVGAGVRLRDLNRHTLPLGWFVAVTPGTEDVSIGGAIAADVHGKNHHCDGSFCGHVRDFTLMTPSGSFVVSPQNDPELFWATAGGMGMTGVVVDATIQLIRVEDSSMRVDTERFGDLDDLMATMTASDEDYRYSVAWVDCLGPDRRTGRSVLTRGDHASSEGPSRLPHKDDPADRRIRVPSCLPSGLVNGRTLRAFNDAWFRSSPRHPVSDRRPLRSFFYPLDGVECWNRLYGRRGFVQYQFAVPDRNSEFIRQAIRAIARSGVPSALAVLKRFGPSNPGLLSFPLEGWTLALDFPIGPPKLPSLLDRLDEGVVTNGGRVYLAKDARLRPDLLGAMYPQLDELARVRRRVDPSGLIQSDLSRRLGLEDCFTR